MLPFNQSQMLEQAKFTYSLLGYAFEKQVKTNNDQGRKEIEALKKRFSNLLNKNTNQNWLGKYLRESKKKVKLKMHIYIYIYDFYHFEAMRYFGISIFVGKIRIDKANKKQVNLLKFEFEGRTRSRAKAEKIEKEKV